MLVPPVPAMPGPPDDTGAGSAADGDAATGWAPGSAVRPSWYDPDSTHRREDPVPLPAGVTDLPAGPELAAALNRVRLNRVSGQDTVDVVKAAYRQACRDRAIFLLAVLETGLREPGSADTVHRVAIPGEFAGEEVRAALVWSRRRTDATFNLAWDVFGRLPMLGEAMLDGLLDEPRAAAFTGWTEGLTDEQAGSICDHLLPEAPQLMVGELIDRIKHAAIAIDPKWAERRYRDRVRRRRVVGSRNPDGTAAISGLDLPVDRAAAACDRVDELARAGKRAGDRRPIDHIRADLFIGMLDGTFESMSDAQLIAHVRDNPYIDPTESRDDDGDDGEPTGDGTDGGGEPDDEGNPGNGYDGGGNEQAGDGDQRVEDGDEPDGDWADGGGRGEPSTHGGAGSTEPDRNGGGTSDQPAERSPASSPPFASGLLSPADGPAADPPGDDVLTGSSASVKAVAIPWSVRELRVGLATLLALDELPAQLPGWDYVPARLARHLAATMSSAEWRYVVCDASGRPISCGITAQRPCPPAIRDRRRGGIVEIHVEDTQFGRITAAAKHGRWSALVTDIVGQHDNFLRANDTGLRDVSMTGHVPAAAARRRAAGTRLRRAVQVRDRACVHPSCRVPATSTDQDHRVGYADGGATAGANLQSACRHDHRLKDEGGWQVLRAPDGAIVWISALGHHYRSRPPPVVLGIPGSWPTESRDDHKAAGPLTREAARAAQPAVSDCGCHGSCGCDAEPTMPAAPERSADEPDESSRPVQRHQLDARQEIRSNPPPALTSYSEEDIPPF